MDFATQSHTSFIPKNPLIQTTPPGYRRSSIPLLTLVAIIVFIISIGLAVGVYFYKGYLEKTLVDKKITLNKAREAFNPARIEEFKRLDLRIEHSKEILANHKAFSSFFDLLESQTLQNVQFRNFKLDTGLNGEVSVEMQGIARSYASVALQSDAFSKAVGIKEPIFSKLNLDEKGNVAFTVSTMLDPSAFKYTSEPLVGSSEVIKESDLIKEADLLKDAPVISEEEIIF